MIPPHFELWGYPGAGKTSIAHSLAGKATITIGAPLGIGGYLRHLPTAAGMRSALVLMRAFGATADKTEITVFGRAARIAFGQRLTLSKTDEPTIVEEGVIHEIWRALYRNPNLLGSKVWRTLLAFSAPRVIVLGCSMERAKEHIALKHVHGLINAELSQASIDSEEWRSAKMAHDFIIAELSTKQNSVLQTIDTDGLSIESVKDEVMSIFLSVRP